MELSAGFITTYLPRIYGGAEGTIALSTFPLLNSSYGSASFVRRLTIMKGTIPSNFSGFANSSSYASDVLITYTNAEITTVSTSNPTTTFTISKGASLSGTATWFWAASIYNGALFNQFIGTVGVTGSGADLEINDVNVVSGNGYRVLNLKIQIPTSWTY